MKDDTILDYALFELSPKHSRCDVFVSSNGEIEKVDSGLIESFVNHLKVLETQSSYRVELEKSENDKSWFTRRTLERFVHFVNNPEVLERVNVYDLEMSQLEAARTLYSQDDGSVTDATKKELLKAIDLRLEALKKDLTAAIAHASTNGFEPQTVTELKRFADKCGAHRLEEACGKYITLWQRRPDLIGQHLSTKNSEEDKEEERFDESLTVKTRQLTRKLSVQERINLFESKQRENSNSSVVVIAKSTEPKRLSLSPPPPTFPEKSVSRKCSIVSDMSFDLASDNRKSDSSCNEKEESHDDATVQGDTEENCNHSDAENVERTRMLSKEVSQGVNDDLRTKANDLEKVITEHKGKVVRNLSYSDDCKGKLYEIYMKKREAKLREDRSSKETKLKSMQEAVERSRTEMKTKFNAASDKKRDSVSSTNQSAEKFRSFNARPSTKKYPISEEEEEEKDKPVIGKNGSRSSQVRKATTANRNSRVTKPSSKVSNTSGRVRKTSEMNPVGQLSVPGFSNVKKENTKTSSLVVKTTPAMRRSISKKTTKEDIIPSPVKPRRQRSLRKSFSANIEFATLDTDDKNQKQNTDFEGIDYEIVEEVKEVVKEEEKAIEMETQVVEDIANDNEKAESYSEEENITSLRSFPQVKLPVPSIFQHNVVASLLDSPSESPLSWSSNLQHAFSYPHDHSDASMDYSSPTGSPAASWSSRMRKKWGTTTVHSPVIVSNSSSPIHSRKDLAKGIKRLLKFGKKTSAADSLMDWGSVTTSEGDDDFAYRSSDELRRSRMASSHSLLSEDDQASNNSNYQASVIAKDGEFKRSFFSLSSFRTSSKGNDSKPR